MMIKVVSLKVWFDWQFQWNSLFVLQMENYPDWSLHKQRRVCLSLFNTY